MILIINNLDIQKIIKKSEELSRYLREPYDIQLFYEGDNKVFKIKGNRDVMAKVSLRGWGKYEFDALQKLSQQNYNVPKPITYVTIQNNLDEKWAFGNLEREQGVLFYSALEGQRLDQQLTKINIRKALNFLKGLHENKSLVDRVIDDYQKIEINRGLIYLQSLFQGAIADQVKSALDEYRDLEVDFCFIHGGPRLEHFIINKGQIWMMDFEGACVGDRFKDLGIFFTDLRFQSVKVNELINMYFKRDLTKEEKIRLKFFELRTLLVKMKNDPSELVLKNIQGLLERKNS